MFIGRPISGRYYLKAVVPVYLTYVRCFGTESNIFDCSYGNNTNSVDQYIFSSEGMACDSGAYFYYNNMYIIYKMLFYTMYVCIHVYVCVYNIIIVSSVQCHAMYAVF